ncbi:MAG: outer membrane lipoprotein-sorting protein [Prevotella sp.]|jgi:outer membrane lipoprotein-sorting protein|nr:outer membrane lipoprotein-sorting protein [Prevotella sp.]
MRYFSIVLIICLNITFAINKISAQSAKEIMIKVDNIQRFSYSTTVQNIKLSTSKYIVKDQKMRFTEKPRVKLIQSVEKKGYGADKKDSRSLAIILEPISDKGVGTITFDYNDASKDADTWIYLPALSKVKRVISTKDDSDTSGSFFGSEFAIEDIENKKIDDFTYKILKEEIYDQRPTWVIESIPTEKKAKKSRYGKIVSWVDKERYTVIREDLYNHQGNLYKQLNRRNYVLVDNVWLSKKVTMNNLLTRRATFMDLESAAFNMDVSDEFLTQRALTDFSFREKNLDQVSAKLKKF